MRQKIADWLVRLARWIDPPNKQYQQFILDRCMEAMITGTGAYKITAVDPSEFYTPTSPE